MENFTPISATLGGIFIGLSAILLMATAGRIAGISGILGGFFTSAKGDRFWRLSFLLGLILGPWCVWLWAPQTITINFPVTGPLLIVAGVCVGVGTQLGGGCTSGHGVCGNARLSVRSLVATLVFMFTGALTVFVVRHVMGT